MAWFMLFGLYLVKHAIVAHVVDVGYSRSRLPKADWWWLSLAAYAGSEMIVTALILNAYSVAVASTIMALEFVGLNAVAMFERGASIDKLLHRHIVAECGMALLYGTIAFHIT